MLKPLEWLGNALIVAGCVVLDCHDWIEDKISTPLPERGSEYCENLGIWSQAVEARRERFERNALARNARRAGHLHLGLY
jgi:hypothetical protein